MLSTLFQNKYRTALFALFVLSLVFNLQYIGMHPFLHEWDERFHALVAKNLADNFLLPLLYKNSPVEVCYESWVCNTVWLHKQPLFLWQMALSIKLFGATEWAVRLPSALMLSLIIFPIYKIGTLLFNKETGLIAALLTVSNWFILEHIDGLMGMDHNDVAFMFYVTLSIWALLEYIEKTRLRYVLLMGLFSGCAMLNKWVTGLLVFEGLFVYLLLTKSFKRKATLLHLLLAVAFAFILFMPWQLYIYSHFKNLAIYEWTMNQRHFGEVIEGHRHEQFYYLNELKYQFTFLQVFCIIGLVFSLFKWSKLRSILPVIVMLVSLYTFFTIAATKIASYTMVTMPLLFVFMAFSLTTAINLLRKIHPIFVWLYAIAVPLFVFVNFNYSGLKADYSLTNNRWDNRINIARAKNALAFKRVAAMHLPAKTAIIGLESFNTVDCMFYTGLPAYGYYVSIDNIQTMKRNDYHVAVFQNNIPDMLRYDKSVIIFPFDCY